MTEIFYYEVTEVVCSLFQAFKYSDENEGALNSYDCSSCFTTFT